MTNKFSSISNNFLNRRDLIIIFTLWLFCFILDSTWIFFHNLPPSWDQAFHLTKLYEMAHALNGFNIFAISWWHKVFTVTDSYRGPLTYLISSPIFLALGSTYKSAILSNSIFNAILLCSIYALTRIISSRSTAFFSTLFCAISPALAAQRTDYLTDFSLTSVLTLSWLILSIWFLELKKVNIFLSITSGFLLGLTALIRPTAILFFVFPFCLTIISIVRFSYRKNFLPIVNISLLIVSFIATFYPWFSLNWLTILTNINNARRWGIAYQEGLEANTLEGLVYYPFQLPSMFGISLVACILLAYIFIRSRKFIIYKRCLINISSFSYISLWFLSLPIGILVICTLMTTKDYRFILPILPQISIVLALLVDSIDYPERFNFYWKKFLIALSIFTLIWNQFGLGVNLSGFPLHKPDSENGWPIESIISEIRSQSPYLTSTLAVLPDSQHLNAFNLEAEGLRQNRKVSARQIVSEMDTVSDELRNFDWFLFKSGDQGVMSNDIQKKLERLLQESPLFSITKVWNLPDESKAYLLQRNNLSYSVTPIDCFHNTPNASFSISNNIMNINLVGQVRDFDQKHLLIDFKNNSEKDTFDHSIAQGMLNMNDLNRDSCVEIGERFNFIDSHVKGEDITIRLLSREGKVENLKITNTFLNLNNDKYEDDLFLHNRIGLLLDLGEMLREGKLDLLFDRIAQINQSDPKQIYLLDAEDIFRFRLKDDPINLEYLYSLSLSQILQRKSLDAYQTLQLINQLDPNNEYAYLAKAIVQLYRFKPQEALTTIDKAKQLDVDDTFLDTSESLTLVAHLMQFNLLKVWTMTNAKQS